MADFFWELPALDPFIADFEGSATARGNHPHPARVFPTSPTDSPGRRSGRRHYSGAEVPSAADGTDGIEGFGTGFGTGFGIRITTRERMTCGR
ncbi:MULTISPECIES: hypothetical protein [Streptomyces]|uniref:Uncharacterized protein n=2 Tax=Streptomyces TaxID=1883 RepID=A0A3Q9FYZ8_STRLT|nr:hypothetical protein [Streptomyces luteoverticillatus]AZQ71840.1 hypothetical protein EKH77_12035 [Streptomyces luteoverticillatus]